MVNNVSIIQVLVFSLIYLFFQQLKRVMIREMDDSIYKTIINYFLSGEYYFIGLAIMLISNFNRYEILISFSSMFLVRFIYNTFLYNHIYRKFAKKIRSHNIYKK